MAQHGTRHTPAPSGAQRAIPDKLYFRIGDVAKLCAVPPYVLRFWESEFPQLKPNKGGTGQRLYRRRDVEMALQIKALLYEEGFTIPGARQALKAEQRRPEPQLTLEIVDSEARPQVDRNALKRVHNQLQELLDLLAKPKPHVAHRATRTTNISRGISPKTPGTPPLFD